MCPYFYYSAGLFQSFFKCNRTSRTFPLRRSDYILPKQKIPPFTGVSYFQITLVFASSKLVRACQSLIVKCVRRGGGFGVLLAPDSWLQYFSASHFLNPASRKGDSHNKSAVCPNIKDKFARQKQPKQICNLLKDQLSIYGECALYVRHNLQKPITACLKKQAGCFSTNDDDSLISVINFRNHVFLL